MSIHAGHRQRLKDRFLQEGLDGFNELNALELLLFYCIPQKDTNPLAHHLLDRFGSFHAVLDASPQELEQVEGVGHNISTFLSLIPQVDRYYYNSRTKSAVSLNTNAECAEYMVPKFRNRNNEMVYILCLDAKNKVLCCKQLGEGSVNSAGVPIRRIVDVAMKYNATTVYLAHNHPAGTTRPSTDDIETTKRVAYALNGVDIILGDHFIVVDDRYLSMTQTGYFRPTEGVLWR